ncbi:MAG: hypothetical protein ACR2OR_01830 [Hyphomicrobiales bacterium]
MEESSDAAEVNLAYQTKDDLWTGILKQNLSQLVEALEAGDATNW